ncbi:hypothetical protein PPUJ20066_54820 [Pseudomonas putida]|nr:hypothetical protein PPUJ20066_54820 [Pseudomonas putida]
MTLAPFQAVAVKSVVSALKDGSVVCHLMSDPGNGLTTCTNAVLSQITGSTVFVGDHVDLAGLDLLGQFYEEIHVDFEFQPQSGVPALVTELCAMKGDPTIFIHDFEKFALTALAKEKSLKQLGWLLKALPDSSFVIVSSPDYQAEMVGLCRAHERAYSPVELGSFADRTEFTAFFEAFIDQKSGLGRAADKLLLHDIYHRRNGNLAWTMLELFHPGYRSQRESSLQ